jgi:hypothetical protein
MRLGIFLSTDCKHWVEYKYNPILEPVGVLGTGWESKYVADVGVIIEGNKIWMFYEGSQGDVNNTCSVGLAIGGIERFDAPVILQDNLAAGVKTTLDDCSEISMLGVNSLALTVEETYHASAAAGGKLHLYTSPDGENWDTEPVETKDLAFEAGETTKRETFTPCDAAQRARFLKVVIENLDATYAITDVKVTATLGG